MSTPNVRQQIIDAIRLEARDVLYDAGRPLAAREIHLMCPSSADTSDTRMALREMVHDGEAVERERNHASVYESTNHTAPAKQPKKKLRGRAPTKIGQQVIDTITKADTWLTIEELEYRLDLTVEQIRNVAKNSKRLASRPRPGAKSGAHEYGLDAWIEAHKQTAATDEESTTTTPDPTSPADDQPIAEPSYIVTDRPANDTQAIAGHRFGLWSDGTLAIETEDGDVDLPPAVTHDLIAYLIRERAQVAHLFDTALEARDD